jgi:hypothetical protein
MVLLKSLRPHERILGQVRCLLGEARARGIKRRDGGAGLDRTQRDRVGWRVGIGDGRFFGEFGQQTITTF